MSLRLHFHPLSSFSHKALIALYEHDLPFERVVLDFGDSEAHAAFTALWPMAKFPVLEDRARDVVVKESTIIVEHIDTFHARGARLLPSDRAQALDVRFWDRFFDHYLEHAFQKIVGDTFRPAEAHDPFGVAEARATTVRAYDYLELAIRGEHWIAGDAFTLADVSAAPALLFADTIEPIGPARPKLAAYFARLKARPSVARTFREAEPYFGMFPLDPKPRLA